MSVAGRWFKKPPAVAAGRKPDASQMAVSMTPAMQAEIRILPGNDKCVDCGSNHPQWASVTYGALMCLECSGAHRGMGVHISFVRSVTMDSWSDKQLKMMTHSSNDELVAFS